MQSIDHLIDEVATYISERKQDAGQIYFSKIDLICAYCQISLDTNIQKYFNFSILGGKATGKYRFINGFFGLTDMPATFQKTMNKTLESVHSMLSFLGDIIMNLRHNSEFAKPNFTWLGFKTHPKGNTSTEKNRIDLNLEIPKTLKQLRSFMIYIHHLKKFTPNLVRLSKPLRPLLSKATLNHKTN